MQAVLLDTSLMLDCAKRKIDVFAGLDGLMECAWEARISEGVMRELNAKALIRGPKGAEARLALAMIEVRRAQGRVIVEENKDNVDGWLLARGRELGAIVCTNDADVRMRARAAGLKVISVLNNSRLGYA